MIGPLVIPMFVCLSVCKVSFHVQLVRRATRRRSGSRGEKIQDERRGGGRAEQEREEEKSSNNGNIARGEERIKEEVEWRGRVERKQKEERE